MSVETLFNLAKNKRLSQTGSLVEFREKHLKAFKEEGILHDSENYKFTNLENALTSFQQTEEEQTLNRVDLQEDKDYINFIFKNGVLENTTEVIAGIEIMPISDQFNLMAPKLQASNPLSHLHHALLSDGICIKIKKKMKIERPIRIFNNFSRSDIHAPTFLIQLEEFAEATLIEEYSTAEAISNIVVQETYISLDTGAQLEHIQVSQNGQASVLHSSTEVKVAKDAHYRNVILNLSGKLTRRNLRLELLGPAAHGETFALYLTNQHEHCDINTVIEHKSADTTSNQVAKGILDEESKGIFTGKIHIHPKAQRVVSGQINKNLLLSKKSQAHSQPQLEIFADDVKCSHGSTTGQLSEEEVFYFEARGIPATKARNLLALAFGLEIVLKIQNEKILKKIRQSVQETLKAKFKLGGTV